MNAKDSKYPIFILFPQEMGYLWTKSSQYMERSKVEIEEIKWEAQQRKQSKRRRSIRPHRSYGWSYGLPGAPSDPPEQPL